MSHPSSDLEPLPAAAVADACIRLGVRVEALPSPMRRAFTGPPILGPALPCSHAGSVDVFLEALDGGSPGSILVIDDDGRDDEACVGDLVVLEAQGAGIGGIVIWGRHRDTARLAEIGLPVWSRGTTPLGPRSSRPRTADPGSPVVLEGVEVRAGDLVSADDDGVLVVRAADDDERSRVLLLAARIVQTEEGQARLMAAGRSLREQLDFASYLARRAGDPEYDLRRHLAEQGGAIET